MPIDIRKYLTQKVQLQKFEKTGYTDESSTPTSVYTVACFSYYGTQQQVVTRRQFTTRDGWTVIVPNSLGGFVAVDDVLYNLVDARGSQILQRGKVKEITVYRHHLYATQFVQLQIEPN